MKFIFPIIAAILIVVIDQITKFSAFAARSNRNALEVPGVIEHVRHANQGLIANFPVPLWLIIGITLIVIIGCLVLITRETKAANQPVLWALGILLGGAIGNFIDRLTLGYVRDWILLFGHSAINLADIAIALGLLRYSIWAMAKHRNKNDYNLPT